MKESCLDMAETRHSLYDPNHEGVFYSQDVVFNESDVGVEEKNKQEEKQGM